VRSQYLTPQTLRRNTTVEESDRREPALAQRPVNGEGWAAECDRLCGRCTPRRLAASAARDAECQSAGAYS